MSLRGAFHVDELLTVRQLQELLSVDRVTIYRMLDAGHLPGFKVGGQWRFSRPEIESWLLAQRAGDQAGKPPISNDDLIETREEAGHPLPLSCLAPIQSVFAEAMGLAVFTMDLTGKPLTPIAHPCQPCEEMLASPEGRRRCEESWAQLAHSESPTNVHRCHAGLRLLGWPVELNGRTIALVVAEQFLLTEEDEERTKARAGVHRLSRRDAERLPDLLSKVALTFSELGQQRVQLLGRLQRIADIASRG